MIRQSMGPFLHFHLAPRGRPPYPRCMTLFAWVLGQASSRVLLTLLLTLPSWGCSLLDPAIHTHVVTLGDRPVKGLWGYRNEEIMECLRRFVDVPDPDILTVTRTPSGMGLTCTVVPRNGRPRNLVIRSSGHVEPWSDPLPRPDGDRLRIGGVEFRKERLGSFGIDPYGRFFFVQPRPRTRTEVRAIASPSTLAYEWESDNPAAIASTSRRIFLFSYGDTNGQLAMTVLAPLPSGWRAQASEIIRSPTPSPAPFYFVGMNPDGSRLIFAQHYDPPLAHEQYYLYRPGTHSMVAIAVDGFPVFLAHDVVGQCLSDTD